MTKKPAAGRAFPERALPVPKTNARSAAQPDVEVASVGIMRAERVSDQVYRRLRQSILHGEIAPGARLRETEIAENLAVSRTPVREAISRLIGDRLVRELPAGGVEVVDTRAEMEEIYAIREALEVCAVGLAASRIDGAQLEELERLLATAEATSYLQHGRRADLNEAFHLTIADAARSPRLAALIAEFREFFLNSSWLSQQTEDDARKALGDHRAIIEALRDGDREAAETSLRKHLGRAYRGMGLERNAAPSPKKPAAKRSKKK
ncbi:MAG: GntR family transcriptional regulator [Rhizobiales bacterium]|nr:GntR family transcriptional regulator [Hyphomicrobiales bacterium]